jgi:hypothetical protein
MAKILAYYVNLDYLYGRNKNDGRVRVLKK